jgi:hypothetical protein
MHVVYRCVLQLFMFLGCRSQEHSHVALCQALIVLVPCLQRQAQPGGWQVLLACVHQLLQDGALAAVYVSTEHAVDVAVPVVTPKSCAMDVFQHDLWPSPPRAFG